VATLDSDGSPPQISIRAPPRPNGDAASAEGARGGTPADVCAAVFLPDGGPPDRGQPPLPAAAAEGERGRGQRARSTPPGARDLPSPRRRGRARWWRSPGGRVPGVGSNCQAARSRGSRRDADGCWKASVFPSPRPLSFVKTNLCRTDCRFIAGDG
jgi:hypothetical protein